MPLEYIGMPAAPPRPLPTALLGGEETEGLLKAGAQCVGYNSETMLYWNGCKVWIDTPFHCVLLIGGATVVGTVTIAYILVSRLIWTRTKLAKARFIESRDKAPLPNPWRLVRGR